MRARCSRGIVKHGAVIKFRWTIQFSIVHFIRCNYLTTTTSFHHSRLYFNHSFNLLFPACLRRQWFDETAQYFRPASLATWSLTESLVFIEPTRSTTSAFNPQATLESRFIRSNSNKTFRFKLFYGFQQPAQYNFHNLFVLPHEGNI